MKENLSFEEIKEQGAKKRTLAELSVTVWLTPENATFFQKNGFLYIRHGDTEQRAFLCRQFPFELLWEFISVLDEEQNEIGIIRNLSLFDGEVHDLLTNELERRYYSPIIRRIFSMKERYGFSYWKVKTDEGEVSFTLHDTFRSIIRAGEHRIILMDVDGNRFDIPDVRELDRKSYKKIELYL
jgi:hypothetical protein